VTLDYGRITPLIVKAVQNIANITGTFKNNLIAWLADAANGIDKIFANQIVATNGTFHTVTADKLCLGSRCMTAEQFNHILDMEAAAGATTVVGGTAGAPAALPAEASSGPPIIAINGGNPATIQVGATYADLGANITGPQADLNLGIHTFVDGTATDPVVIDTSIPGTHTIDYVVTASSGKTSSAINQQTVYTLSCAALDSSTYQESMTVNLVPAYQETRCPNEYHVENNRCVPD